MKAQSHVEMLAGFDELTDGDKDTLVRFERFLRDTADGTDRHEAYTSAFGIVVFQDDALTGKKAAR